jgi:hypothetical protein
LQVPLQWDMFASAPPPTTRLDTAVDSIHLRFGKGLLTRASLLPKAPGGSGT